MQKAKSVKSILKMFCIRSRSLFTSKVPFAVLPQKGCKLQLNECRMQPVPGRDMPTHNVICAMRMYKLRNYMNVGLEICICRKLTPISVLNFQFHCSLSAK